MKLIFKEKEVNTVDEYFSALSENYANETIIATNKIRKEVLKCIEEEKVPSIIDEDTLLYTHAALLVAVSDNSELYVKAVAMLEKLIEKNNDPRALNELAICYVLGRGVKQDKDKAFCLYEKAAKKGHAVAQCSLGLLYAFGKTRDKDKAFYWYKKSAKNGYAFAMNYLGNCYLYGIGVNKSKEDALYWYKKSVRQGNNIAQYNLGRCYLMGEIVGQDYKKAFNLFKKSATKYNIEAMFSLGCLYFEGKGTRKNVKKAIDLWEQTAKFNHKGALYYLGVAYYEGKYVKQDLELAKLNLEKASEQGVEEATQLLNIIKKEENAKKAIN